jgi:antitoxin MazE
VKLIGISLARAVVPMRGSRREKQTRWTPARTLVYIQCRYMGTITQVAKWGNSLGLRLPKSVAREAQLDVGDTVDVSVDNGAIVIRPSRPRYSLDELVRRITPKNRHDESDWGGPLGDEVW